MERLTVTKLVLGESSRTAHPGGHKHAQTLTYESAGPTQMCLPCQGAPTQFTPSKQGWNVGTTCVSLGSQGLEEAARNILDALPQGPDRKRRRR